MSPAPSPEIAVEDNISIFKSLLPNVMGLTDQEIARNIYHAFQERNFVEPWKQALAFELAMLVSHYGIDVAMDERWPIAIKNRINEQINNNVAYYVHTYCSQLEPDNCFYRRTAFEVLGDTIVDNREYPSELTMPNSTNGFFDFVNQHLQSGQIVEIAALGFLNARSSSELVIHDEEDIGIELSFIASLYLQKLKEINADYFDRISNGESHENICVQCAMQMEPFSLDLLSNLRENNVYWEPSIPEVHAEMMRILFHHN